MQQPQIESSLLQPMVDAMELFTRLNISYALIGGIAAMVYGRSRFTEDVDFVAASNHQNILSANPDAMSACRFDPSCTWKLYHTSGITLDIWKDQFSDQIAARAHDIQIAGRTLRIADVHDLIAMKLRAARFQDDYDISEILRQTSVNDETLRPLITLHEAEHFAAIRERLAKQGRTQRGE